MKEVKGEKEGEAAEVKRETEERVVLGSPVSVITSPISLSIKSDQSPLSPSDLFFFKG
jgi:hypothetical protein